MKAVLPRSLNTYGQPMLVNNEQHCTQRRRAGVVPEEFARASESVEQYSRTPLDLFKLWPGKSFFFSPSQLCVIAYQVSNNVAIALGDPVGPEEEIESTTREFL